MQCDTLARKGGNYGHKTTGTKATKATKGQPPNIFRVGKLSDGPDTAERHDGFNETRWSTSGPTISRWTLNKYPTKRECLLFPLFLPLSLSLSLSSSLSFCFISSLSLFGKTNEVKETAAVGTNIIIHSQWNTVCNGAFVKPFPLMSHVMLSGRGWSCVVWFYQVQSAFAELEWFQIIKWIRPVPWRVSYLSS